MESEEHLLARQFLMQYARTEKTVQAGGLFNLNDEGNVLLISLR